MIAIIEGNSLLLIVRFSSSVFRKGSFHLDFELKPGFMPCILRVTSEHMVASCEFFGPDVRLLGEQFMDGSLVG